ncbi:Assembly factor cbp4 [Teratosphaeriaceae sp. CCFEE 6253]|nr:Assembly factor cbp4 [Teratosphaeriaceae sp. CCFEE 6253]KAK3112187.1 Assembly factor cbp4 [Teratosphaeriaceae sp. CCFEE 6253]
MRTITWVKMAAAGGIMCIGGPALIYYVSPTEEELFLKYNPELQKRSLERRHEKQEEFDIFVNKLKEYSKSDKPIWNAWEDDLARRRAIGVAEELDRRRTTEKAAEARRQEMKESLR